MTEATQPTTDIAEATARLRAALATEDRGLIRAALRATQPALFTFNPRNATPAEATLEGLTAEAYEYVNAPDLTEVEPVSVHGNLVRPLPQADDRKYGRCGICEEPINYGRAGRLVSTGRLAHVEESSCVRRI